MMYLELQSCIIWSSRRICFRTEGLASMRTIYGRARMIPAQISARLQCHKRSAEITHLLRHYSVCRGMFNFLDTTSVPLAQLLQILQILVPQVKFDLCVHIKIGKCIRKVGMICHPTCRYRACCGCRARSIVGDSDNDLAVGFRGRRLGWFGGFQRGRSSLSPCTSSSCGCQSCWYWLWFCCRGRLSDIKP